MRTAIFVSLAAVAAAHNDLALCTPERGCVAAEPSWVAKFSVAAAGPEQFWINLGATPDVMVVGWLTANMGAASTVQYGTAPGQYTSTATGKSAFYKYSAKYTSGLIHHVPLTGLKPSTTYYYLAAGASQEFNFTSSPGVGAFYPYTFGVFADIGESINADSTVIHMIEGSDKIDSYFLNGDISYASGCEHNGCGTWDAFQRMMQPLAAYKPIAIAVGNHEQDDDANGIVAISTQYRFAGMPHNNRSDGVMFFSYEVGPAHVISLACFYPGGFGAGSPLMKWLTADLASIDRSKTPWVLVSLHAPWYNSNTAHQGDGEGMRVAVEPMLLKAGVNAIFTGHVHSCVVWEGVSPLIKYERSLPVANNVVVPAGESYERSLPVANNVVVPAGQGIVHFNIGDAGAGLYTSWLKTPSWSAFHSAEFGHGELVIKNATAAVWTWHRNSDREDIIADTYVVVNTHTA